MVDPPRKDCEYTSTVVYPNHVIENKSSGLPLPHDYDATSWPQRHDKMRDPTSLEKGLPDGTQTTEAENQDEDVLAGLPPSTCMVEVDDLNLVQWEGDTDPENPMNWARCRKWVVIVIGSPPLLRNLHAI